MMVFKDHWKKWPKNLVLISKGIVTTPIDLKKKYHFKPTLKIGDNVKAGSYNRNCEETPLLTHSILIPPDSRGGKVMDISSEGDYDLEQIISTIENSGTKSQMKITINGQLENQGHILNI